MSAKYSVKMALKIVSDTTSSQRHLALKSFGLALRELAAHTMRLSVQCGDALDFHSAFSKVVEKIKNWPDGQLLPSSDELMQELSFCDGRQGDNGRDTPDSTIESIEEISAIALTYVAAIYQENSPQIWTEKRCMLEACAKLVRIRNDKLGSSNTSSGKKCSLELSSPMRSALDYFLSDHPIRRATKLPPKRSTIRALIRREMLVRTGNGTFDYLTNNDGRIAFVGAPS